MSALPVGLTIKAVTGQVSSGWWQTLAVGGPLFGGVAIAIVALCWMWVLDDRIFDEEMVRRWERFKLW